MQASGSTLGASWRDDESLKPVAQLLDSQGGALQVVSFDFFDTLICRLCADPADLFVEVGRRLAARGDLLVPLSPVEFKAARMAADERARESAAQRRKATEVTLTDIYAQLGNVVRDPQSARALEFEIERNFCFANPSTVDLARDARACGYRTAIVSDTYFTRSELETLLTDQGIDPSGFDLILASSEVGRAKWDGRLYHDLLRHFDVHPSEVLHLGDNLHADVHCARQYGIEAVHYYKTNPNLDSIYNGERHLQGTGLESAASLQALRTIAARRFSDPTDPARDGALVFGPVLSRYADWCVERFQQAGVQVVLALMREGAMLGELVIRAAQQEGVNLVVIPCFVSRLSTARAALSEVTPRKAAELLEGSPYVTPQAVLDILGIGQEATRFLDAETLRKPLATGEAIAGFLTLLFKLPRIRDLLEQRRAESHRLAFDYLAGLIGDATHVGVIDLGWSGSIQRNVARILRQGGREVRTLGCYLACTRRAGRLALDGDLALGFLERDWARSTILPEVAITAACGSTDGYVRDETGLVKPVLGPFEASESALRAKDRVREGILAFQSLWLDLRGAKAEMPISDEMLHDLDAAAAPQLYRLLEYPTKPEADRLGVLSHDENYFGQNHNAPLCDDDAPKRLRREGLQNLFQSARSYWPQGVVARTHPRLVSVLRAGWTDPTALGRMGAWHSVALHDAGMTDEELSSLGALLHGLAAEQVIFTGQLAPVLEEVFLFLWNHENRPLTGGRDFPRLILLGEPEDVPLRREFLDHCVRVGGDPSNPAVLNRLRKLIDPEGESALVLTHQVTPDQAGALLNGLSPFLGKRGTVLAACGLFDRHNVEKDAPLAAPVNTWWRSVGQFLGYAPWSPALTAGRAHLANWITFRRAVDAGVWNRQWMFSPAETLHQRSPAPALIGAAD